MDMKKKLAISTGVVVAVTVITIHIMKRKAEKTTYVAETVEPVGIRKIGFYEKYIKRIVDIVCAICAIVVFST